MVGIILGQNIDEADKVELLKHIPTNVKIMKTRIVGFII